MSPPDMRLRLAVRRYGVPEVKLVWPCARSPDMTIAKLLSLVNDVVPLESSEWGMEDYAVELSDDHGGTYECLHFQQISDTLKDEDQVIIRSLLTDDIKRRRLSGRHQISTDGKHLVDGVAFGRPWLRVPRDRPALELPPRKRARILNQEMCQPPSQLYLEGPEIEEASSLQIESLLEDDEDDDFEPNELADGDDESDLDSIGHDGRDVEPSEPPQDVHMLNGEKYADDIAVLKDCFPRISVETLQRAFSLHGNDKSRTFRALLELEESEDAPEFGGDTPIGTNSPMEDLVGRRSATRKPLIEEVTAEGSDDENGHVFSPESSEDTSSAGDSDTGTSGDESTSEESDDEEDPSSDEADGTNSSSSEDGSSSDSEDSSDSEAEAPPDEITSHAASLPHQGLTKTQKRNARRRRTKLLKSGQETSNASSVSNDSELQARKQALLGALVEDASAEDEPVVNGTNHEAGNESTEATTTIPQDSPARRRAKIDLGAGRRMLFGALGLKAPKSKTDEEHIRQGLMKDVKPLKNARIVEVVEDKEVTDVEDGQDGDAWKSKISYRAVECCHEDVVLSEPPFPFVQRWDPRQQYASIRKRKRNSQASYYNDSYHEEDSMAAADESGQEVGSAKASKRGRHDLLSATVDAQGADADDEEQTDEPAAEDLPALPEDLGSLTPLERGSEKPGMIITWKQWTLSKATQWQPVVASVTGEVLPDSEEGSLQVRLAMRDREQKERQFDEQTGQRIYDKFETPDMEDDEQEADDGQRVLTWEEMIEPRILTDEYTASEA